MATKFVAPYRMSGKNDAADAAAICEAVQRPNMRFVPIKTETDPLAAYRSFRRFVPSPLPFASSTR